MLGGQINDPSSGKHYLVLLPATPSSSSPTLEGLFELTGLPSRALDTPCALLPVLQRYKDAARCGTLGAELPGHHQQQLTQTSNVRLLKTHFFTPILGFQKSTEYNWFSDQTWPTQCRPTSTQPPRPTVCPWRAGPKGVVLTASSTLSYNSPSPQTMDP